MNDNFGDLQRMRHERELSEAEFQRKFKMFFAGLSFAILSFEGSHPILISNYYIKIIEIAALLFIFFSGLLLLFNLSGVRVAVKSFKEIRNGPCCFKKYVVYFFCNLNFHYWMCFVIGISLLLISRAMALFSLTTKLCT